MSEVTKLLRNKGTHTIVRFSGTKLWLIAAHNLTTPWGNRSCTFFQKALTSTPSAIALSLCTRDLNSIRTTLCHLNIKRFVCECHKFLKHHSALKDFLILYQTDVFELKRIVRNFLWYHLYFCFTSTFIKVIIVNPFSFYRYIHHRLNMWDTCIAYLAWIRSMIKFATRQTCLAKTIFQCTGRYRLIFCDYMVQYNSVSVLYLEL